MSATAPIFTACSTDEFHILTRARRWLRYRRSALSLLGDIDFVLACEGATGQLVVHYSQGRVQCAEFRQEAIVHDAASDAEIAP